MRVIFDFRSSTFTVSYISLHLLGLSLSAEYLLDCLSNWYISPGSGKFSNSWCGDYWKMHQPVYQSQNRTHVLPSKTHTKFSSSPSRQTEIIHPPSPNQQFLRKSIFSPAERGRGRTLKKSHHNQVSKHVSC